MAKEKQSFIVRISKELWKEFKHVCVENEVSANSAIVTMVQKYVDKFDRAKARAQTREEYLNSIAAGKEIEDVVEEPVVPEVKPDNKLQSFKDKLLPKLKKGKV